MFNSSKHNRSPSQSLGKKIGEEAENASSVRHGEAGSVSPFPPRRTVCRTVTFCRTDREVDAVRICPVPSLYDMSDDEIQETWYTDDEMRKSKRAILGFLKRMIAGTVDGDDLEDDEETTRGLENKTPRGSHARKENRYAALCAVLDEQAKQREYRQPADSDYIARLYHQSSAHSQIEAIEIAAIDAKIVRMEQEKMARIPDSSSTSAAAIQSISIDDNLPKREPPSLVSQMVQKPTLSCIMSPHKDRSRRRLLSMMN